MATSDRYQDVVQSEWFSHKAIKEPVAVSILFRILHQYLGTDEHYGEFFTYVDLLREFIRLLDHFDERQQSHEDLHGFEYDEKTWQTPFAAIPALPVLKARVYHDAIGRINCWNARGQRRTTPLHRQLVTLLESTSEINYTLMEPFTKKPGSHMASFIDAAAKWASSVFDARNSDVPSELDEIYRKLITIGGSDASEYDPATYEGPAEDAEEETIGTEPPTSKPEITVQCDNDGGDDSDILIIAESDMEIEDSDPAPSPEPPPAAVPKKRNLRGSMPKQVVIQNGLLHGSVIRQGTIAATPQGKDATKTPGDVWLSDWQGKSDQRYLDQFPDGVTPIPAIVLPPGAIWSLDALAPRPDHPLKIAYDLYIEMIEGWLQRLRRGTLLLHMEAMAGLAVNCFTAIFDYIDGSLSIEYQSDMHLLWSFTISLIVQLTIRFAYATGPDPTENPKVSTYAIRQIHGTWSFERRGKAFYDEYYGRDRWPPLPSVTKAIRSWPREYRRDGIGEGLSLDIHLSDLFELLKNPDGFIDRPFDTYTQFAEIDGHIQRFSAMPRIPRFLQTPRCFDRHAIRSLCEACSHRYDDVYGFIYNASTGSQVNLARAAYTALDDLYDARHPKRK